MKRIDKTRYRDDFNVYSKDYLCCHQTAKGNFMPRLADVKTYHDKFSAKKYKFTAHPSNSQTIGWLRILLNETHGRCCYCMRCLPSNDNISIEHLVPEQFGGLENTNEFQEYDYYAGISPDIRDHVVLGSVFDNESQQRRIDVNTITHIPHLIAHSNLFPACQDTSLGCSCNQHRKNQRILPLMLIDGIEDMVEYMPDGKMNILYPDDSMVNATLTHLDINCATLILIRKLWYKFSRKNIRPNWRNSYSCQQVDSFLRQALELSSTDLIPLEYHFFAKEETNGTLKNFSLFLQYNWFYHYYSQHYPIQP